MSRDMVSMNPVSQSHSWLQAHWHSKLALTVLMEVSGQCRAWPPLALTPLSRSVLSRWRWLSPGFSWRDDSPVTNWSQSIYLVTEFQLDCDRGDTGERRAEVRCKDECRNRVRDGREGELMFTHWKWTWHVTHFANISFQRTKAKYHELNCSNPVSLQSIVDRATK